MRSRSLEMVSATIITSDGNQHPTLRSAPHMAFWSVCSGCIQQCSHSPRAELEHLIIMMIIIIIIMMIIIIIIIIMTIAAAAATTTKTTTMVMTSNNNNDDDNDDNNNNIHDNIERRNSKLFIISSLRELSPTHSQQGPGRKSSANHVQYIGSFSRAKWLLHMVRKDSSLTNFDRVEITFIFSS